MQNAVKEEL